jgi:hypothetical protein
VHFGGLDGVVVVEDQRGRARLGRTPGLKLIGQAGHQCAVRHQLGRLEQTQRGRAKAGVERL